MPRRFLRISVLLAAAILPAAAAPAPTSAPVFRAGAATSNITPQLGDGIVGNFDIPPATHIHDELHARCLVLDDGKTKLGFVIVDSVSVNREVWDEAKRRIEAATKIPAAHLMMAATHTHSATSARGRNAMEMRPHEPMPSLDNYQAFLASRIADGVQRAVNNLAPARLAFGTGRVPQHVHNRRWILAGGKTAPNPFGGQDRAIMNPGYGRKDLAGPAGPTNPEVYFVSVQTAAGRPLALLANYWLHYVGGVPRGHVSADYFGVFCDRIQELLGADRSAPPFVGLLANGPCADVNNIDFSRPAAERRAPYEKIRLVAEDVAQEVMRVHRTLEFRDRVELKAAQAELELPTRRVTPELEAWARQVQARPATVAPTHRLEKAYAERTLTALGWPESLRVILQAFRIGDFAVAAIPFETFTETGLAIRAASPFRDTMVIELANGGYGYLPTPEQHALGGYETWLGTNRVGIEASRKIEATLARLLAELR